LIRNRGTALSICFKALSCANPHRAFAGNALGQTDQGGMIAALFLSACKDCAFSFWRLYQQYGSGAHRLAVRTAPSHGANRGSIPLGRTSIIPFFAVQPSLLVYSKFFDPAKLQSSHVHGI